MKYVIALISTFLIVYFIIPFLMKLFVKYDFLDKPTKRKNHRDPIPLCGGVGMFIGFFIVYFLAMGRNINKENISVFIGALAILIIGLVDDYYKTRGKEFPIYPRFLVQILAAILVYNSGISFSGFTNPITGEFIQLHIALQFLLTVTWLFGVTTVINWSDGMDGLAGSISTISSVTLFIVAIVMNQSDSAIVCIILVGAILGFLNYNRHPAVVFMGDSGANFLGFILGIIALDGAFKQATIMSLFIPILALGVPIFDNIFVIFKRYTEGKPVYQADRSQIHFRLQEKGLTTNQVVAYICAISFVLSLLSIVLLFIKI
ncbi:MraY family glycosyltransferase [Clostridium intestinale]|uniref:Undecaprenyl/decaprenyl-phosphate alpha-N-acetylglucosaminyl 1-phosphate transferase n=1 Tax=Clostridium intestinale TaxID=36845 RepID=A0A7D6VVS4_9CLOT|nr:MraY family glycosyltransferase [Clostridium intestinale]QLY81170.1 undecaprenyl/decaprenyl-phosphate alpha-N-acetylglucosaminyl 1-phosphate transferase [Clostridium intestinale]